MIYSIGSVIYIIENLILFVNATFYLGPNEKHLLETKLNPQNLKIIIVKKQTLGKASNFI